ncbi:uncharacterized protein ACBR49_005773 isoform 2-T2 [Aulostomus maculatus]
MSNKGFDKQRVMDAALTVLQRSCRRALQLFCWPLDPLLNEKLTYCPVQNHQTSEANTTQVLRPPSTILIVNICNSTLNNCVIGNNTNTSAGEENPLLAQIPDLQMDEHMRCSCSLGQQGSVTATDSTPHCLTCPSVDPHNINIHSSHLSCVIIGNNNNMEAEQTFETEEPLL